MASSSSLSCDAAKFEVLEKQVQNAIEVTIHRILHQAIHLVKKFPPKNTANLIGLDVNQLQKCMIEDLMKLVQVTQKIVPKTILCDLIVKQFPFIKKNIRRRLGDKKAKQIEKDDDDDDDDLDDEEILDDNDEKDKKEIDEDNMKDKENETEEDKKFVVNEEDDDGDEKEKEKEKEKDDDGEDSENDEDYQPGDSDQDDNDDNKQENENQDF